MLIRLSSSFLSQLTRHHEATAGDIPFKTHIKTIIKRGALLINAGKVTLPLLDEYHGDERLSVRIMDSLDWHVALQYALPDMPEAYRLLYALVVGYQHSEQDDMSINVVTVADNDDSKNEPVQVTESLDVTQSTQVSVTASQTSLSDTLLPSSSPRRRRRRLSEANEDNRHNNDTMVLTRSSLASSYEYLPDALLPLMGKESREQQQRLADFLTHTRERRSARLVEASTGIGKSLAIVVAAVQSKRDYPEHQMIITAPTLAILTQLEAEYRALADVHQLTYSVGRTLSKYDFLSDTLLQYWLDEHPAHRHAKAVAELRRQGIFTRADYDGFDDIDLSLLTVATAVGVTKDNDAGVNAFYAQRQDIREVDIVFTTHTMLALNVNTIRAAGRDAAVNFSVFKASYTGPKKRLMSAFSQADNRARFSKIHTELEDNGGGFPGVFAQHHLVFIDEAHLFDDMVSLALRDHFSLPAFIKTVTDFLNMQGQNTSLSRVLQSCHAAVDTLSQLHINAPLPLRSGDGVQVSAHLQEAKDRLATLMTPAYQSGCLTTGQGRKLLNQYYAFAHIMKNDFGATVAPSPKRRYMRLTAGAKSSEIILDGLVQLATGVSATSATMHVPVMNQSGYEGIIEQLCIPAEVCDTHPPLESSWLKQDVHAYVAPLHPAFDPTDQATFLPNVAKVLTPALDAVQGGSLILCTSYEQIEILTQLFTNVGLGDRIMAQQSGQRVASLATRYLERYYAGERPIWLGTGSAWTGLDVSATQQSAEHDHAIALLAIVKLPFDANHSVYQSRTERMKTTFRTKQGVGRLKRRAGRPPTQLYLLDGRVHTRTALYKPIKRFYVDGYRPTLLDVRK